MEYDNYFKEAFQKLNLLEQDFDITADVGKVDELKSFVADDREAIPEEPIYDVNADEAEDLEDEYIGKVILECECCHSKFYKDPDEVIIDPETSLANIEEECPLCNSSSGYTVIGKIEPFTMEEPTEEEVDMEEVEAEEPIEVEEEEVEESLQSRARRRNLREAKEDFEIRDRTYEVKPGVFKNASELTKDEINELIRIKQRSKRPGEAKEIAELKALLGEGCEDCEDLEECGDQLKEANRGGYGDYSNGVKIAIKDLINDDYSEEEIEELPDRLWDKYVVNVRRTPKYLIITDDHHGVNVSHFMYYDYLRKFAREIERRSDESLTEGVNNLSLDTDDTHLEMAADESGRVTVTTEPLNEENDIDVEEEQRKADEETKMFGLGEYSDGEEVLDTDVEEIVPLDAEDAEKIEANSEKAQEEAEEEPVAEEEEDVAEEEVGNEEDEEDLEFDEFDEESFDEMGESYLRKVYDNVKSYKTTSLTESQNILNVKGLITFNSGNTRETNFVFTDARHLKNGKVVLEGYNNSVSKSKKAFSLKGNVDNKKFISESLGYHYITKSLDESIKVTGRIKKTLI